MVFKLNRAGKIERFSKVSMRKRKLLLTGSHRSGTTWVGKIIAASPTVGYIHEPFNPTIYRPWLCDCRFHGFTYVTARNESAYIKPLQETFAFSYNWWAALHSLRNRHDLRKRLHEYRAFRGYRKNGSRPLVKDPIAVFSAEWLASTFDMDVVVLIRHPAAFVSSIKRVGWTHDFSDFLAQEALMQDYLHLFEADIKDFSETEYGIFDQAILIWRLIHHVIIKYREKHANWVFLRHEDISNDPVGQFEFLFRRLHIPFSKEIKETVEAHSASSNPVEPPGDAINFVKRDSKANIFAWKDRLSRQEIDEIKARTHDIYPAFYSEADW